MAGNCGSSLILRIRPEQPATKLRSTQPLVAVSGTVTTSLNVELFSVVFLRVSTPPSPVFARLSRYEKLAFSSDARIGSPALNVKGSSASASEHGRRPRTSNSTRRLIISQPSLGCVATPRNA